MKFINKQLSIKFKEKGFDKPCFGFYITDGSGISPEPNCAYYLGHNYKNYLKKSDFPNTIDSPTIEQVLEWLREEKNVHIGIMPYFTMSTKNNILWQWEILLVGKIIECKNTLYVDKDYNYTKLASADCYSGYDNAFIDAIEFVINNLI